jgi:hypothetical protein
MKVIGPRATAAALPFDRLIAALREGFARGCVVPQRQAHQPADGVTSLIMPAWIPGGPYAVKIINRCRQCGQGLAGPACQRAAA